MSWLPENQTCPVCPDCNVTWMVYESHKHGDTLLGTMIVTPLECPKCGKREYSVRRANQNENQDYGTKTGA